MSLENEIKTLIIESLELEDVTVDDIKDEEPLFISGLGLDSIDALELGMALKKKYQKETMPAICIFANKSHYLK